MSNKNSYTEIFENKIAEKLKGMILPYKDILSSPSYFWGFTTLNMASPPI